MSLLIYRGYLLSFTFMCLNFVNKYLSRKIVGIPPQLLVGCRFAVMFLWLFPMFFKSESNEIFRTKNMRLQLIRAMMSFAVLMFSYIGYRNLHFGIAAAISASEPIFVVLWAFILRKEKSESATYLIPIVLLGFFGMFMIHSGSIIAMNMSSQQMIGLASLLMANIVCSVGHHVMAKLVNLDNKTTTAAYGILFNCAFMLVTVFGTGLAGQSFDLTSVQPYIIPIALLGTCAWLHLWTGMEIFKYLDPSTNSGIQNLSLPLSMLISYFVEGESIDSMQIIGIIAIFLSTLLLSYRKFNLDPLDTRYEKNKPVMMKYIYSSYVAVILCLGANKLVKSYFRKPVDNHAHKHDHSKCSHKHDHDHTLCG